MKNWKTTLGGALGAVSIPLMSSPDPRMHLVGGALAIIASLWLGYHAADKTP